MILKKEIAKFAEAQGTLKTTIDKDWVLGHFIDGIYSLPELKDKLIFKGGTCLRKCYFENYRFSEDLDFTSNNPQFELTMDILKHLVHVITDRTEIPLHIEELKPLYHNNKLMGYKAVIKFWGADHPKNQVPPPPERWTTSIKIEVILYEKMVFSEQTKIVYHPYSDQLSKNPLIIPCYSLHEVLSEKLRALIQRSYTAPRDFYDIWYLSNHVNNINWTTVIEAFFEKIRFKEIDFTGVSQMLNYENDITLHAAWNNSLAHQIAKSDLPDYDLVKRDLVLLFNRIF
jgi:predicted nucleotidyltransferase component of viral defense system